MAELIAPALENTLGCEDNSCRPLDLILSAPLALLSFAFYRAVRWVLRELASQSARRNPARSQAWQPISAELLRRRGVLPLLMTSGPRWNPHAVIATAGPLDVAHTLEIDTAAARASASQWFFVVHRYPTREIAASISSLSASSASWETCQVPAPGQYVVAARYYEPAATAQFPRMRLDGRAAVAPKEAPPETNAFYRDLCQKQNAFYYALAYYIAPMLRCRRFLGRTFVEREYLPVGNPATQFRYGVLKKGERIHCRMPSSLLRDFHLYVTIYSRQSFPILWYEVNPQADPFGPPSPAAGYYLIRLQPRRPGPEEKADLLVSIRS